MIKDFWFCFLTSIQLYNIYSLMKGFLCFPCVAREGILFLYIFPPLCRFLPSHPLSRSQTHTHTHTAAHTYAQHNTHTHTTPTHTRTFSFKDESDRLMKLASSSGWVFVCVVLAAYLKYRRYRLSCLPKNSPQVLRWAEIRRTIHSTSGLHMSEH